MAYLSTADGGYIGLVEFVRDTQTYPGNRVSGTEYSYETNLGSGCFYVDDIHKSYSIQLSNTGTIRLYFNNFATMSDVEYGQLCVDWGSTGYTTRSGAYYTNNEAYMFITDGAYVLINRVWSFAYSRFSTYYGWPLHVAGGVVDGQTIQTKPDSTTLYESTTYYPIGTSESTILNVLRNVGAGFLNSVSTANKTFSTTIIPYDNTGVSPGVIDPLIFEHYYGTVQNVLGVPVSAFGTDYHSGETPTPTPDPDPDPYNPGGTTTPEEGGTSGTWNLPSDELSVGASIFNDLAAGLYRAYRMSTYQVSSLGSQLWDSNIVNQIFNKGMKITDIIMALISYPFEVTPIGSTETIQFNWLNNWVSSGVTGNPLTSETQHLTFGEVDVPRYSGIFYDYQPYSSIQLHLPYIGFVPVKVNEVLGRKIYVDYYVLLTTGDFTAHVTTSSGAQLIGIYQGQIGRTLPLAQDSAIELAKSAAGIALTAVASAVAGVQMGAQVAYARKVMTTANKLGENGNAEFARQLQENLGGTNVFADIQERSAMIRRNVEDIGASSIQTITGVNSAIQRNGNLTGINGRTSHQEAFILMSVPHQNIPSNQRILGYPTNLEGPLSSFTGYTEVREIRMSVPKATSTELAEIEEIVRGGIII